MRGDNISGDSKNDKAFSRLLSAKTEIKHAPPNRPLIVFQSFKTRAGLFGACNKDNCTCQNEDESYEILDGLILKATKKH